MTKHYNKSSEKEKRRTLRKDQTFCEKILWHYLRDRLLLNCKFRRQYSIDQFVIDFYSPELKLAIELDGNVHDDNDQKIYDVKRQEFIEAFGITFLRLTNTELLENANLAFAKIEEAIKQLKQKRPHP
ncbi:MAG: endonuclease domain-containing protein [Ignavibacteriaceae bacterium]